MIYTAPYVMLLMRANPLRGQVGVGWAQEIETFLGPVKRHRAVRRVPFGDLDLPASKALRTEPYNLLHIHINLFTSGSILDA
jgi:hypothetical protein